MDQVEIIDITPENVLDYGLCGYKSLKKPGYPEKVEWLKQNAPLGLRIQAILSEQYGVQGMIEYIPGEYCWRPVEASGYLFIHCLFVGFKKAYKGHGYAGVLIERCLTEAKDLNKYGVAVVTRKGSFMVGHEIFRKMGFEKVDAAPPDFELLCKSFKASVPIPTFKASLKENQHPYKKGLVLIRADQCPYTVKNVSEIMASAEQELGIQLHLVDVKDYHQAQQSPCAFGTFCIVYEGEVIAHHPISKRRFLNLMKNQAAQSEMP